MTRSRLPQRRPTETFTFDHEGVKYIASFGRDNQGHIRELFLDAGKQGSSANIVAKECAVVLSLALQYRVPLETISDALPKLLNGQPAGPLGVALGHVQGGAI